MRALYNLCPAAAHHRPRHRTSVCGLFILAALLMTIFFLSESHRSKETVRIPESVVPESAPPAAEPSATPTAPPAPQDITSSQPQPDPEPAEKSSDPHHAGVILTTLSSHTKAWVLAAAIHGFALLGYSTIPTHQTGNGTVYRPARVESWLVVTAEMSPTFRQFLSKCYHNVIQLPRFDVTTQVPEFDADRFEEIANDQKRWAKMHIFTPVFYPLDAVLYMGLDVLPRDPGVLGNGRHGFRELYSLVEHIDRDVEIAAVRDAYLFEVHRRILEEPEQDIPHIPCGDFVLFRPSSSLTRHLWNNLADIYSHYSKPRDVGDIHRGWMDQAALARGAVARKMEWLDGENMVDTRVYCAPRSVRLPLSSTSNPQNPYSVHFAGGTKPWECNSAYSKEYWKIYDSLLVASKPHFPPGLVSRPPTRTCDVGSNLCPVEL